MFKVIFRRDSWSVELTVSALPNVGDRVVIDGNYYTVIQRAFHIQTEKGYAEEKIFIIME